jgi:hypothetical protein
MKASHIIIFIPKFIWASHSSIRGTSLGYLTHEDANEKELRQTINEYKELHAKVYESIFSGLCDMLREMKLLYP